MFVAILRRNSAINIKHMKLAEWALESSGTCPDFPAESSGFETLMRYANTWDTHRPPEDCGRH